MGNSDIREIANIREDVDQSFVSGSKIAVDAPNWLYKYMTTTSRFTNTSAYETANGNELPNLIGVPQGLKKFFELNIEPIFVFDGIMHDLKENEIQKRKKAKQKAEQQAKDTDNRIEKAKYQSRSQHLTNTVINTTKEILDILDIPYITAEGAAEAQAAHMTKQPTVDYAISDDYDSLIFGSKQTIRDFSSGKKKIELMDYDKTLANHNINHDQLILFTLLCGTDYNDGVYGVGPKTAIDIVTEHDTLADVENSIDETIPNGEEIFNIFKNPDVKTYDSDIVRRPDPDTEKLTQYLETHDIDMSEVAKTIEEIDKHSTQTGIGSF